MGRLRNQRHELLAQALAEGKSPGDAMVAAGYPFHRGNQYRLARTAAVIARVEEIKRAHEEIVDLSKLDRGRILTELARIAFANQPVREAIAVDGIEALPADQPVLHVTIRLEGALARPIEMRLFDDRGALSALLLDEYDPTDPATLDFGQTLPDDFHALEEVLRALLRNRETCHSDPTESLKS